MFKSVFAKYVTTFMSIIFVSFLILVLLITSMVNRYAVGAKQDLLENAALGMADFLGEGMKNSITETGAFEKMIRNSSSEVERNMLVMAAADEDITMLLVNNDGKVLRVASRGQMFESDATVPRSVLDEINSGVTVSEFAELKGVLEDPHFFYAAPVFTTDGISVCGTVLACAPSASQDALLGVMIKTVVVGSLWVMLAALIAVYIITERVISPLKEMSLMAKEFAFGNFNARVPVKGKDEVAELAVAFNNMAGSLSQLEVMRNTFMANVSHDLRTPMTTISGFIDNILSGAIPPEKHEYYLGMIRTEVQRLARLVASLLDISRIQAGDRKFEMKPFDICEMARLILFSFEQKIENKRLEVEFYCDDERMIALADHDAIYQILYNICDNAVKFSCEGGLLRVSLQRYEERRVLVSVYNAGEGIAADDLPFVFERFYKADKSRGLDKSGAGLGMFIAKTIIDAHKQNIWVESTQGEYCEFKFTLPLQSKG